VKTYGGSGYDFANSIRQTLDGGYIIVGSTLGDDGYYNYVYVKKLNSNGEVSWHKGYDNFDEQGRSIQETIDGGIL